MRRAKDRINAAGPAGAASNPWIAAGQKAKHNPLGHAQATWPAVPDNQAQSSQPVQQPGQQQWGQAQWSPPNPNDRRG